MPIVNSGVWVSALRSNNTPPALFECTRSPARRDPGGDSGKRTSFAGKGFQTDENTTGHLPDGTALGGL